MGSAFDSALIAGLTAVSECVLGDEKYPVFHLSSRDTGEKFGFSLLSLVAAQFCEPFWICVFVDY